jgi:hypothetical protein
MVAEIASVPSGRCPGVRSGRDLLACHEVCMVLEAYDMIQEVAYPRLIGVRFEPRSGKV